MRAQNLQSQNVFKAKYDEVYPCCFFDHNFGLSEDESIDEDDGICSLGKSRIDRKVVLSMGQRGGARLNFMQERFF